MKRKKRGNSLIVVVTTCMFVTTVSAATLTMVAGNYKARVFESKRVENLYASDSGINVAYTVIGKTFDAASNYGKLEMEMLINGRNKGPNQDDYTDIKNDIDALTLDIEGNDDTNDNLYNSENNSQKRKGLEDEIDDLKADKENADDNKRSKLNKQIESKRSEISKKRILIEEDKEVQEILLNEEFKRAFKMFIKEPTRQVDKQTLLGEESAPNKLEASIEDHKYVSNVKNNGDFEEETIDFDNRNGDPDPILDALIPDVKYVEGSLDETKGIAISDGHHIDIDFIVYGKQYYDITITSDFYSKRDVSGVVYDSTKPNQKPPNERKLQASHIMTVPNYEDIFYKQESGDLHDYLALHDRALTIDKDMNVDNANTLKVNGNIFVNGNPDKSSSDRVYGKYFGGITLNNSNNVLFNNNVITRGTFNIRDKVGSEENPAKIIGDLYAGNIYAGTKDGKDYTNDANLSANKVVIDNDLALKAKNTHIKITNFYGINDKNIYYKDNSLSGNIISNRNSNPNDKARTSSSIIINDIGAEDKRSSVTIENEAYIMGTAHIDTENKNQDGGYQTGESTAVKGNYEAYSVPIEKDASENFEYHDPLQLLEQPNVFKKAEHFRKYWNPDTTKGEVKMTDKQADTGGIIFNGSVHSVGALVYKHNGKKEVVSSTYQSEDLSNVIIPKQLDYAKNVYKFGQNAKTEELLSMYDSLGANAVQVSDLMNLSQSIIDDNKYDLDKEISSNGEKAIFNYLSDVTLIVQGKDIKEDKKYYNAEGKVIKNKKIIKVDRNNNIDAVIATTGDVIIDGDVTINGSIIANGNLNISGSVIINYEKDIVDRIQAQEKIYNLYRDVFGGSMLDEVEETPNQPSISSNINYDLKNFLKNEKWKIIK